MAEFANLLRQRLASGAAARVRAEASHPDADTLTAYVERLLSAPEREQILEHVAACSHCREIVATAMAPSEPEVLVHPEALVKAAAAPRRRWFAWSPGWGLAASGAVLGVIAVVVLTIPAKKPKPAEQAKVENTAPIGVPPAAPSVPPADSTVRISAEPSAGGNATRAMAGGLTAGGLMSSRLATRRETATTDRLALAAPDTNRALPLVAANNNKGADVTEAYASMTPETRRDYVNNDILAGSAAYLVNGKANDDASATAASPTKDLFQTSVSDAKRPILFQNLPSESQNVKRGHFRAPPSRFGGFVFGSLRETRQLFRVRPAIPPNVSAFAMGGTAQLNPLREKNQAAEVAAAPPTRKDVSELGQSSAFIFGNRAKAEAGSASAMKADKRAESSPISWKTDGGQLLKCESPTACVVGYPGNEGIAFSIASAHGSEIWAGGNDAALVHSSDDGATWERITLGASAKGTITGIDVAGLNIQVRSSSGQGWSSQDGGKSWNLQE